MPRYGGTGGGNANAPYGTCPECGWKGRDWGFKYRNLCKRCHAKWRQQKARENRELAAPNMNVRMADGTIVTQHVAERLRRRASYEMGPRIMHLVAITVPFSIFLCGMLLCTRFQDDFTGVIFLGGGVLIPIWAVCRLACVRAHLIEKNATVLARARQQSLQEQRLFYASPEWRLLREQVIAEQGRRCRRCGRSIVNDFDLTVDHIRPRSKFPELALDRSNLEVLCRQCNSSKGDTIPDGVPRISAATEVVENC